MSTASREHGSQLGNVSESEIALTGERDHVKRLQPYLDSRPRSIVRAGAYVLLDGEWRFERDPEDRGLEHRWYLEHDYGGVARWPGSVVADVEETHSDAAMAGGVVVWYERDFSVPEEWRSTDDPVQLTFGACGYETRVWLNGTPLTTIEGEDVHLGEYTSFSFELPDELIRDVNRLTVRVADSLDPDRPRGKQESRVYKRGGIWYQAISGPVRSVWLEPVERNRLRSRLSVVTQISEGLVELGVTTRVRDAGTYRLHLVVAALDQDEPCATRDVELVLEPGDRRQHVVLHIPDARLWSTATPSLYRVVAQLRSPKGHVSQIETRFGMREFVARGRRLYLNDEPIYLDGILYQPGIASFQEMRGHLFAMRELGCNLVRVHITGIDPRIYALADEIGMLLWLEVPSPHRSSERSRAAHWGELQRMLVHAAAQPSVVMLSLYNESWGAEDIATDEETRAYITRVKAFLRQHYPQLLVVDNDGWEHVSNEGRVQSDVLTAHVYRTDTAAWSDALARLEAGDADGVTALPLVVGDPFFYSGQLPLVVSEWGGFGFSMYGGPADADARADRICSFKRALREHAIAGDVYTQATSVEDETNGLLDPDTAELLVPAGVLRSDGHKDTGNDERRKRA
jgi:beta-galactosidase/beta-glucuronidase